MLLKSLVIYSLIASCGSAAPAQEGHSPYAGQEKREIKALSPADIEGYQKGRGMGLAKAAELNRYPGPMHVLQLAAELKLSPEQKAETQRAFEQMRRQAVALGKRIVDKEAALDSLFASQKATEAKLNALTREIGTLQGELRAVHLRAHLRMKRILTPQQIANYNQLRGYSPPVPRRRGGILPGKRQGLSAASP